MSGAGADIGAVIIGRNEGERLRRCLASLPAGIRAVYVDSGSTDGSVVTARTLGVEVLELDMGRKFTAARARNQGFAALETGGAVDFVQFIDGDCELQPGWIAAAGHYLQDHPDVAAVSGRLRERFPQASIYNRLCDDEWNTPVGEALACGGNAMMRADALRAVGGFNPDLIAGEEPELCQRLRRAGWKIWRLDHEMMLHDAAMTRLGQWWRRMRRGGHAAAEGAQMHGKGPDRHGVGQTRRALFWGAGLPLAVILGGLCISAWAFALLLTYPLQILRLARRRGGARADWEWAFFNTLGKFPEALGVIGYHYGRLTRRQQGLIEYK